MAPSETFENHRINESYNSHSPGLALEATSEAVDEVNILKSALKFEDGTASKHEKDIYAQSEFDSKKNKTTFRRYEEACDRVKSFYCEQHEKQTVAYNLKARHHFHTWTRAEMTIWEALERLEALTDDSDPDTSVSQIEHLLQTAEAIRRDGKPRWMQLTGLVHDLGKLLFFYGAQGQWDVVGDTFPVGCAFDRRIIYPDAFEKNPDSKDRIYSTEHGIYSPGCGLDFVMISWGHDEYMWEICRKQSTLPDEALAMIRYHSFYSWHSAGAYEWLMNDKDKKMLKAVKAFNPYDLYSKSDDMPSVEELKPYYLELIDEYFPSKVIKW